jgi:hypothetical protein
MPREPFGEAVRHHHPEPNSTPADRLQRYP